MADEDKDLKEDQEKAKEKVPDNTDRDNETRDKPAEDSPIKQASALVERIEAGNKKTEELLKRQEELLARQMVSGRAELSDQTEQTPEQKAEEAGKELVAKYFG